MIELLSPAGSPEAVIAAVQNGADAIYLGLEGFNARRGAKNFNPVEFEDPDITRPAEERSIGGLGIFLVKKTMNGMKYRRKDGKNILTIKKKDTSVKR